MINKIILYTPRFKMRKQKIIVCEHCKHIAIFSNAWESLHLAEDYECFSCGNKNGEKKRNYKYGK